MRLRSRGARAARLPPSQDVFTPEALAELTEHCWPGNVRELANVIEHALILCDRLPISTEHLPHRFTSRRVPRIGPSTAGRTLREIEVDAIAGILDLAGHASQSIDKSEDR